MSAAIHPSGSSSAETCAQCAQVSGCAACFEELVRRFQTPLLHYLLRRVRSNHDAEDLVQETFLVAYRRLDQYRPTWRFSTWLFTIAHRLAITDWRRRRPTDDARTVERVGTDNPLAEITGDEQRSRLWDEASRLLEPEALAALWLSYVESMSAEEVGQVLGRSANAVRILLHRSRNRLAEGLGSHADFGDFRETPA